VGCGELVSFTAEEHHLFGDRAEMLRGRAGPVQELVHPEGAPHERAALESALIDLALRQAGASLADLVGVPEGRLRWVASFAALADPVGQLEAAGGPDLKLDVHPAWGDRVIAALQVLPVIILDWKGQGSTEQARRVSAAFPDVIFEDPPEDSGHAHIARDRPLAGRQEVAAALGRGELVNLKGPRMGGFLELLRALERAPPGAAYFGGMYEVGPGREQARQLAALFCPDAPNDLAPFSGGASSLQGPSPSRLALDRPGFGSNLDWSRAG
jgi:L-alanine-DL-glutamate epimerase-like enolase superfamily enzyme